MEELSRAEQLEQKRIYWKQHIDSWQATGLTQTEYCRRHNLKHHQLVYWKKRFLKTEKKNNGVQNCGSKNRVDTF